MKVSVTAEGEHVAAPSTTTGGLLVSIGLDPRASGS